MKKLISIILTIALLGCMIPGSVLAGTATKDGQSLTVGLAAQLGTFYKNQVAKASYTIISSQSMIGASAKIFIDGVEVENAGSDYFVLYGNNTETFDVFIPNTLDPAYLHTLGVEIKADNGLIASSYHQFKVSAQPADVKVAFLTEPLVVTGDVELYYNLVFSVPVDFQSHTATLRFEINGKEYPELDEKVDIINGSGICKRIPVEYVDAGNSYYKVTVKLNPGSDPALPHATATSEVKTVNFDPNAAPVAGGKIKPVIIPGKIMKNARAYTNSSLTVYATTLPEGTQVEYIRPDGAYSLRSAQVKTADGSVYWVSMSDIYVSNENFTIPDDLTNEEREAFVNYMGYESPTPYLIWVNKQRQRLTVFMGSKGNWKFVNTFPVATGTNLTPTPTTVCTYTGVTKWVEPTYICYPVLSLYAGYAIHNQPVSHSGYVTDKTIGKPASHGCIRMLQQDVNWVYAYVPVKTTVVLY